LPSLRVNLSLSLFRFPSPFSLLPHLSVWLEVWEIQGVS
jgi:hypothetical protein